MQALIRLLCAVVVLASGLAVTMAALPGWVERTVGLSVSDVPAACQELEHERCRTIILEEQQTLVAHRMEEKSQIVDELIRGRVSLSLAASRFIELNSRPPVAPEFRGVSLPGDTPLERMCHNVLDYVRLRLMTEPRSFRERTMARLRGELRVAGKTTDDATEVND